MRVIGTAGHVDHGKSTLVQELTGINPDRLREEQEREMTIVLGFAWMTLADGNEIGIIDVPGHRDFIENMLSGISHIDAVLFVVAADEGVMPQTREHLAILDLLQIQNGVVVLSKIDLIDDQEWLDLVENDIRESLSGTVLESAPMVRVSAKTGIGIEKLKKVLEKTISGKPSRPDLGKPRMSIDRIFSMSGFGTVVTGTLTDGQFSVGEEVTILPTRARGRIRGLQTHQKKEDVAKPGRRTAMNISGVDVVEIKRGDVVTYPGGYEPTRRVDLHFRLLEDVASPIKHNTEVKLFIGAAEVFGRLRLLGVDTLKPGEEGWLQIETKQSIIAVRGDRYIIRRPSPGETIGGGVVVDPFPKGRHKRYDKVILNRLNSLLSGSPSEILYQSLATTGLMSISDAVSHSSLDEKTAYQALKELIDTHQVVIHQGNNSDLNSNYLVSTYDWYEKLTAKINREIDLYHNKFALRLGIPREMLKSKLDLSPRGFNIVMTKFLKEGKFSETLIRQNLHGLSPVPVIHLPDKEIIFTPDQKKVVDLILQKFSSEPYSPPTIKSCIAEVGEDIYNALVDLGQLSPLSEEIVFRIEDYQEMVNIISRILNEKGVISVAQIRDLFNTSRRYVLALLEHLDSIGLTYRDGDIRRLKK